MKSIVASSDRWEHSQLDDVTPQILKFAFMAPLLQTLVGTGARAVAGKGLKEGLKGVAKVGVKETAKNAVKDQGKEMAMNAMSTMAQVNAQKTHQQAEEHRRISEMGRKGAGTTAGMGP